MSSLARLLNAAANAADLQFALDVGVKATALLLAAAAASAVLRRSSAALRHRVWSLTFAALVLLPGLSAALPKWRLPILPRAEDGEAATEAAIAAAPPAAEFAEVAAPVARPIEPAFFDQRSAHGEPPPEAFAAAPSPPPAIDLAESETPTIASAAAWQLPGLATIWLAGVALALAPLAIGLARMFVLRRQSRAVDCAVWTSLVDEVRARLGLARRVALLETRRAVMPMTWGLVRPAVLLPSHAREWTERLRRIVLLHELAHVKRYDVGFQLLGRLTCALYWFHPLAWYALRRLRIERELACDDCVVHSGELASDYAAELLQIARTYQPVPLAAAIAMAQRSSLEHRIRAMFDRACSHLPLSGRAARLLLAGVIVFVTALAAVRLAPRGAAEDEQLEPPVAESSEATPSSDASSEQADEDAKADDAAGAERHVAVRVADAAGKPVAGARVRVIQYDTRPAWVESVHAVGEARTDAAGAATVAYAVGAPFAADGAFVAPTFFVLAEADGYALDWSHVPADGDVTIALSRDDVPVEGRVLDLEGRPRRGVRVSINSIQGDAENLEAWIEAAKRNPTVVDPVKLAEGTELQVSPYRGQKQISLGSESVLPAAITDAQGRFRLTGLGRDRMLTLELTGEGMAKTWLNVLTRDMAPLPYSEWGDPRFRAQTCFGAKFDLTTEPDQSIVGVVRDAESGQPLPGVEVRLNHYAATTTVVEGFLSATTDAQGRYALRGVPKPHDLERGHVLRLVPSADLPYFRTELEVARQDGLDAVTCDTTLKRAIWLRGRITDAKTGKPIRGLVEYYPFVSNQAASDYRNFVPGMRMLEGERYATADDGSYRLPALPGRGLLAFTAREANRYPQSDGVETIAGLHQDGGRLNIYHLFSLDFATALREVNPPAEAVEAVCDIELESLDVTSVKLVDTEGRPLEGAVAQRLAPYRYGGSHRIGWPQELLLDSTVEILGPRDQSRTVMFLHRERQLAAAVRLSRDREPPKTIVLRRCATLSGRVVDREGKPIAGLGISIAAAPEPGAKPLAGWAPESIYYTHQLENLATGPDGAFRIENVPPGAAFVIDAHRGAERLEAITAVVQPGDSFALGDVVLAEPKAGGKEQASAATAQAEPAAAASADDAKAATEGAPRIGTSLTNLRGRVLAPDGKPLAGAKVFFWAPGEEMSQLEPKVRTAADGGFEFTVDRSKLKWPNLKWSNADDPWTVARIVAAADGYGYDWAQAAEPDADGQYVIRLVNDVPIRGRILSLEGQPIAKAKLTIRSIQCYRGNRLDEYIAAWKTTRAPFNPDRFGSAPPGQPASVETDADGRFNFSGLGAERVADLVLEGEGIANARLLVMTRESQPIIVPAIMPDRTHGATFTYLAEPSRLIRGVVRERGSRKPIAGVMVRARSAAPISTKTDAAGRFELHGHAKAAKYFLDASGYDSPHFSSSLTVADQPGFDPIDVEFEMARGAEVSGRVTTAPAGKPNPAYVEYRPLYGNPYTDRLGPGFANPCSSAQCDAEGRYTIPVLPGPGLLTFQIANISKSNFGWDFETYARAWLSRQEIIDFYESAGVKPPEDGISDSSVPLSMGGQAFIAPSNYNEVALINPADGATSLTRDIELPLGGTLDVKLVDADGNEVAGAIARGLTNAPFKIEELQGPEFILVGLGPRIERQLIVEARERKLAAYKIIRGEQQGPLTVRLEPCGSVAGRLLDAEGEPLADTRLGLGRQWYFPADFAPTTDSEGKFRVEGLVPGMPYGISVQLPGVVGQHRPLEDIIVAPGETKDVGDVRLPTPRMPAPPMTAPPMPAPPGVATVPGATSNARNEQPQPGAGGNAPPKDQTPGHKAAAAEPRGSKGTPKIFALRGRVLTPDGKPAAEAALFFPHLKRQPPQSPGDLEYTKRAATDEEGRFEVSVSSDDFPSYAAKAPLFAFKPGFGLAWIEVDRNEAPQEAELRLVEDRPIHGRVTDTEGRPVAKARIEVNGVLASSGGKLDEFLAVWKRNWNQAWIKLDQPLYASLRAVIGAESDSEGRFELSGVGLERVARVEIAAPGFASVGLHVVNRTGFDPAGYNQAALDGKWPLTRPPGMIPRLAGPVFEHIAEAELTIRGKVFAGADRAPAGGVVISTSPGWGNSVSTTADAAGNYKLRGLPRNQELLISFRPSDAANLLNRTLAVHPAPGETAITLDAELKPGIIVEGRVFDRATGKGVKSGVRFAPLPGNSFVDQPGYDGYKRSRVMEETDHDGRFRLMIIPGPGVLMAQAFGGGPRVGGQEITPYRQACFSEAERKQVAPTEDDDDRHFTAVDGSIEFLTNENAVKVIDVSPDAGEIKQDLSVDPGKLVEIAIADDQGKPLPGAFVAGVADKWPITFQIAEPNCTIYALGADRPRLVCLLHPERRLAASLTLSGEEVQPVTVRLAAAASITGRVLDNGGAPLADAIVQLNYARGNARELERFASLGREMIKTDGEGRFQLENIVPGERFVLDFKQGDAYFRANLGEDQRQLKAGQQLELGDAKVKRLR